MSDAPVNVLLVEDDDVDALLIDRWAQRHGWKATIRRAHNGEEALAILRGEGGERLRRPYMILLDLNMPIMGGLEFLEQLRADDSLSDSVVLILTTSSHPRDVQAAYGKNVAGYLLKTVDAEKSGRLIESYLDAVHLPTG